jgi:hypothetical protein
MQLELPGTSQETPGDSSGDETLRSAQHVPRWLGFAQVLRVGGRARVLRQSSASSTAVRRSSVMVFVGEEGQAVAVEIGVL